MSTRLEERIAHLMRVVDDLSDVVARQEDEITRLKAQTKLLMDREIERAADGEGGVFLGDQPPPHY